MSELVEKTTLFFRDPSALTTIIKRLAPLFGDKCKVASVGCSKGDEVFSLLFLNQLARTGVEINIDGYDYRQYELNIARKGIYPSRELVVPPEMRLPYDKYRRALSKKLTGELPELAQFFVMPQDIREKSSFTAHDISKAALPRGYPIILCANVLYHYFWQNDMCLLQVLDNLADSLEGNGYIVCEDTYTVQMGAAYSQVLESHKAFRKRYDLGVVFPYRYRGTSDLVSVEQARVFQKVN
ncbi:hypothetical protein A2617_04940 [Candidatus Daviesbacteria bacterium RIFOXYD1_FULL_41_10]|uniref:CheR-type methyltransferase domain-containing protein n=2 Tax=Candidatus Daviesiibacteriota TaxID=1752718 RepID=A0A1F5N2Y6_9BACT|nr:MAG: hypothetical protein UU67_C0027G0005 [Candidatus Daviesbacteria bacterium GW2011_GWB1_41_5]OGE71988.1 MAG: hypothetical protein A2617_04940 [Candidatus Daviesbacteria bacterium RIFOXYD1_FULL_41_10]